MYIRGSSLVVLVEAFGVCDVVQFLIKSRVRFGDKLLDFFEVNTVNHTSVL